MGLYRACRAYSGVFHLGQLLGNVYACLYLEALPFWMSRAGRVCLVCSWVGAFAAHTPLAMRDGGFPKLGVPYWGSP